MKRVFAFLSVLALTFMLFGIASQPVAAADVPQAAPGKWVIDPTLAEDEIPLYVAGSITTSFPQHFDEAAAKGTEYEDKAHRVGDIYPWNETKILIPRYNEAGAVVGTYSVYPLGGNVSAVGKAAGQYILKWEDTLDKDGNVTGYKTNALLGYPSLSEVRHNFSSSEVTTTSAELVSGVRNQISQVVFDGQGKIIRGVIGAVYYQEPEEITDLRLAPEFGFKDGVITKIVNGDTSGLDRVMVKTDEDDLTKPILNDLGEPVLDEHGNPTYEKIMVPSDEPNLFYKRFLWQYFATKPENVNTVAYLQPGWRADFWDYYDEETGIAYLFLEGDEAKNGAVNQEQADVHNTTLGLTDGDAGFYKADITKRPDFLYFKVPAGGTFYDFGFIDRGTPDYNKFFHIFEQGLKYGRSEAYQMVRRAYNFSAKPLELVQTIQEGQGYIPLPGQNVYEIIKGTSFKPSWVVNINGMLGGFTDVNDILSYKNTTEDKLDIEVDVNGKRTVFDFFATIRYMSREEMVTDFVKDFYEYLLERPVDAVPAVPGTVDLSSFSNFAHGEGLTTGFKGTWVAAMQAYIMWNKDNTARPSAPDETKPFFIMQPKYYDKWIGFFDTMDTVIKVHSGTAAGLWGVGAYTPVRRINLYVQGIVLANGSLDIVPENWIFSPHEYKYNTFNEMVTAFLTDYYAYLKTKSYVDGEVVSLDDFIHGVGKTEGFDGIWKTKLGFTSGDVTEGKYPVWGHYAEKPTKGADNFAGQYFDKWMWLFEHFHDIYVASGLGTSFWKQSAWTPMTKFCNYLVGTLFTPEQVEKITDADLFVMPIYVQESGFVEKFPPAYRELVIDTSKANLNNRYVVDVRVFNKETGLSSTKQVVFVVVDTFRPILVTNRNNSFIPAGVTKFDIRSLAKAYDRYYDKFNKDIKGNDISHDIKFEYSPSFDPNNLVAGQHEVIISITSFGKTVTERVFVTVPDVYRPIVETRDIYLPYGADFNPVDGIVFAYDNLDGNLFNSAYKWYTVLEGDDINTNIPGEYTVRIAVYDKAGNVTTNSYSVYVSEQAELDQTQLKDDIVSEIEEIIEEKVHPEAAIGGNCETTSATYFISAIAVLGIALLVFRKKQ